MSLRRPWKSLAITGLGTFVGSRIAERLLSEGGSARIVGLDLRVPRRLEGRVRFHRVDLAQPTADSALAEILEKERCDAILHTAFFTDPHPDVEYAHEVEVIGSLHVMNAAAAAGVGRLVMLSSAQVYGARADNPAFLTESHRLRPPESGHQIRDRAEAEGLLALFARRHPQVRTCSLRPGWVIGPSIESAVVRHFEGTRVTTLLGYDPLLQFLHEDDLLDAVDLALGLGARGAFNLAGRGVLALSTLLRLAGKRALAVPHPLLYRFAHLPSLRSRGDPAAGFYDYLRFGWTVDCTRAQAELGFQPTYTTKEAWMSFVVNRKLRRYR